MQPGDLISGKYRLLRLIGAGAMGSVWAARNELTDRDFALKSLLPVLSQNKEALQRFFHEARACGQIKHPAVVDVYDMGTAEDGSPYLVMELLEGEGFDQRLARSGTFRPGEAAVWLAFIARGLEEAHVRGLVHRDLKPGNIFFALDDRGDIRPKVLDFGVSKGTTPRSGEFAKTSTGAVLGSPAYMSPEQARGEPDIDARSDVWSLGVILYETLTGQVPFDAANYNALMVAIITEPHRPVKELAAEVPAELATVVDQALMKDRSKRIGTARELAERLEAIAASLGDTALPVFGSRSSVVPPVPVEHAGVRAQVRPQTTTQGTWSGGKRGDRWARSLLGSRRRSSAIAAGMAGLALVIAGLLAMVRLRPPDVAVAGRVAMALATSMSRLDHELELLKTEADAEREKAQAPQPKIVLEPSDLPPAHKPLVPLAPKPRATGKDDPHGGVDSAGF